MGGVYARKMSGILSVGLHSKKRSWLYIKRLANYSMFIGFKSM